MDREHHALVRGARWVAAVVACGALLAGCGSGGGWPTAAGSPSSGADAPAPSAAPDPAVPPMAPAPAPAPAPGGGAGSGGPGGGGTGPGGSGGADGGNGGAQGSERCHTSELAASIVNDKGGGAAGSTYVSLQVRNQSGRTCVVRGFPGVSYVAGSDGRQVGPAAAMNGGHGQPVTLAPGAGARATLRMVNVQNYDPADCAPVPVRGLRVYPPGETDSLFVAKDGTGCSKTPPGDQLVIQAFGT